MSKAAKGINKSTSTGSGYPKLHEPFSLEKLLKTFRDLPEPPVMYAVDFNLVVGGRLPENTIIFSSDLADKLIEIGVLLPSMKERAKTDQSG